MTRPAILIANTAKTSDPRTSVTLKDARKNANEIEKTLTALGQYSFSVEKVIDAKHNQALTKIKDLIDKASSAMSGSDNECLLIYYFGHAVQRNNDLYFKFKNSDTSKLPTLIAFQDIAEWIVGYGVRRTLFVLDCCFAGAAMYMAHATMGPGYLFSIVASTVPTQRAHVQEGQSPFGVFSLYFFDGLRDQLAANQPTKEITVDSLFRYTREKLQTLDHDQEPYLKDGGLNELVLAEVKPERVIDPRFSINAPRKSLYRKIWWIATEVSENRNVRAKDLYTVVQKQRPVEFLTPIKKGNQTTYQPVKFETFSGYIEKMKTLGMLAEGEQLDPTVTCRKMLASDGADYNQLMIELIEKQFGDVETSLDAIDSILRHKLQTRGIPTSTGLYLDARRREKLRMTPEWFGVLIDLAANCGYFRFSSRKTYFPY